MTVFLVWYGIGLLGAALFMVTMAVRYDSYIRAGEIPWGLALAAFGPIAVAVTPVVMLCYKISDWNAGRIRAGTAIYRPGRICKTVLQPLVKRNRKL